MYQIEEYEDVYIVLFNAEEIGRFDTEKEAKEFAIVQTIYSLLEE